MLIPHEELVNIAARNRQVELLNSLLSWDPEQNPSAILVHGPTSTGKSYCLQKYLNHSKVKFSWIACQQCSTLRILLQKAIRLIKSSGEEVPNDKGSDLLAVENFGVFFNILSNFFSNQQSQGLASEPHILVLDRIDQLPDVSFDIYSCFARISEMSSIHNLVVIFAVNSLEPRALVTTGVPHIHFPRYTKAEALQILAEMGVPGNNDTTNTDINKNASITTGRRSDPSWQTLQTNYLSLVYDTLGAFTGTDVRMLRLVAEKIWPVFIRPIEDGRLTTSDFGKLYKQCEYLFASEVAVIDRLVDYDTDMLLQIVEEARKTTKTSAADSMMAAGVSSSNLPIESKYILCAAYLASYNPPRYDGRFFSRAKEARAKRRDTGRRKQLKINPRSLAAPPFDLERMLAILHSLMGQDDETDTLFLPTIDVGMQIATLTTLRLIVRTSSNDPLDSRTRWRINASWDMIEQVAREIGLTIHDYLIE